LKQTRWKVFYFSSRVTISVPITRVHLWDYIEWLEEKLNEKYELNLQGLKRRFYKFYNVVKGTLEYTLMLNDLVT